MVFTRVALILAYIEDFLMHDSVNFNKNRFYFKDPKDFSDPCWWRSCYDKCAAWNSDEELLGLGGRGKEKMYLGTSIHEVLIVLYLHPLSAERDWPGAWHFWPEKWGCTVFRKPAFSVIASQLNGLELQRTCILKQTCKSSMVDLFSYTTRPEMQMMQPQC